MVSVRRLLETSLYVEDPERVAAFYRDVLGFRVLDAGSRLIAMDAGEGTVLLLFRQGSTASGAETPGGRIPPHEGQGPLHLAFAVDAETVPEWTARLAAHGVPIESRVRWSRGGESLYFRDPAGHSIELATPGVWPTY